MDLYSIKNLVLSGGGVKGYAYVGVIKALEEYNIISKIESIAGTSIGAVFAFLVILKYSFKELQELSINLSLDKINNISSDNILDFLNSKGIDDGYNSERVIKILLKAKTNKYDITFKELYEYNNVTLNINSYRLNDNKNIIFNHINYPDFSVIKAIRMSISIPFFFTPVNYNNSTYVDGGVKNNFLINLYENMVDETIGFLIEENSSNEIDVNDIQEFFKNIFYTLTNKVDKKIIDRFNIISIKTDVHILDLNIDNNSRNILINNGYQNTKTFLENFEKNKKVSNSKYTQTLVNCLDKSTQTD